MFNETQIESYQNIKASADLREKVLDACQNTKEKKAFPVKRTVFQFAPIAACLIICFAFSLSSLRSENQPFVLMSGDTVLDANGFHLPPMQEEANMLVRTVSMAPRQYTVSLWTDCDVEILSADGIATMDETGNLSWTIDIPEDDAAFHLYLRAGGITYDVPLQYHVQDGSFSICCQEN